MDMQKPNYWKYKHAILNAYPYIEKAIGMFPGHIEGDTSSGIADWKNDFNLLYPCAISIKPQQFLDEFFPELRFKINAKADEIEELIRAYKRLTNPREAPNVIDFSKEIQVYYTVTII